MCVRFPRDARSVQRAAWLILSLTALLAVLQYLYYNTEFVQLQGRYLFPGLIPLGVWIALGVDSWRRLIFGDEDGTVVHSLHDVVYSGADRAADPAQPVHHLAGAAGACTVTVG